MHDSHHAALINLLAGTRLGTLVHTRRSNAPATLYERGHVGRREGGSIGSERGGHGRLPAHVTGYVDGHSYESFLGAV